MKTLFPFKIQSFYLSSPWLRRLGALLCSLLLASQPASLPHAGAAERIPVVFDTDIGDDIDDTWALGLLLRCPELDVKLVVGDMGRPLYRARLLAKFLETVNRTDIPVGVGIKAERTGDGPQAPWLKNYKLDRYPGQVHRDGVQAMIDTIMSSKEPVTLIAVGPLPNLTEALKREPRIAKRARFVGMHGSVRLGYGGNKKISAEYNVRADAKACQAVFTAPWDITITPLDTCGLIHLTGDRYRKVREATDPLPAAIIENYRFWSASHHREDPTKDPFKVRSSTLFDTVAIYLAITQEFCTMEELGIRVTDDGFTRIDPKAKKMSVATSWKDMDAFNDWMVQRLTAK